MCRIDASAYTRGGLGARSLVDVDVKGYSHLGQEAVKHGLLEGA